MYFDGKADVEAIITNNKPSKNKIGNGYRPAFKVKKDYLTSGMIRFLNCKELNYREQAVAEIWFITPDFYPKCLEVGQVIVFQEGKEVQGFATITKIINKKLER